jgi:hypothetical protein
MKIAIHDSEKSFSKSKIKFPNLALMKISAYHKQKGDTVTWWKNIENEQYDRVYSSKVFTFTPSEQNLPENTIRGGTGYIDLPLDNALFADIENTKPDYSIYPNCDFSLGYLTRGCIRNCAWCIVPQKEGKVKSYRNYQDIFRADLPLDNQKIVLMDNNILACSHGVNQLEELSHTKHKIDVNQGLDCRLVTPEIADILTKINWIRYIRFSCDTTSQIKPFENTVKLLCERNFCTSRVFVYLLVSNDLENACEIVESLKKLGNITIYAQVERDFKGEKTATKSQKEFANRYIYGGKWRKETWKEYCFKRNLCEKF